MDLRIPAQCRQLLPRLHSAAVNETHPILLEMVTALLSGESPAVELLSTLEELRPVLAETQHYAAERYASHPLPPDSTENATLLRVLQLWAGVAELYRRLAIDGAHDLTTDERALTMQRRIRYLNLVLVEHFRAHRSVAEGHWRALHTAYLDAERASLARQRVADPLNAVWKAQSPAEAYITGLLVDLANPYGRRPHELTWVIRWAQRFAPYCSIQESDGTDTTGYATDLTLDSGLRPAHLLAHGPTLRRLDASRVGGQIRAVVEQFKQGVTPAALGLGDDCPREAGGKLLVWLYRPWAQNTSGRRYPRRRGEGLVELCLERSGIEFCVNRGAFEQPVTARLGNHAQDIRTLTYGERVDAVPTLAPETVLPQSEHHTQRWDIVDQSVAGFRLRGRPRRNTRIEHLQLIGLRPADGRDFLLGQVTWLCYQDNGDMEIGVQMLTGVPRLIGARRQGGQNRNVLVYQPVFLLPALAAMKAPETLVLPAGWFSPQQVLEIHDKQRMELRLTELLAHGPDFEQVAFERILPARS